MEIIKGQNTLETTHKSLRAGGGEYCVNNKHIIINSPEGNVADIQEHAIAAGQVLNGRNIALYGMAALVEDAENPGRQHLAPNATLVNKGIIEMHVKDMVEKYKSQIKATPDAQEGLYRFVKCYAMAAGKNSMIINDGIIRVYFDQGADSKIPVYGETLLSGENSTIINNGKIELYGEGSTATQARAIAVPANNMTIINKGEIKVDMEKASTVRMLATTGLGGIIINYGSIDIKTAGRIMTLARFANTLILNEGSINIVSKPTFIVNKVSFLYQSYPLACAFYEHCLPNTAPMPPIINNGTVKVHLEGSEASTPHAVAFGVYSEMLGKEEQTHRFENTGSIRVTKSGPYDFQIAELGANVQAKEDYPYNIEIGEWHTEARDFKETKDLFLCGSGIFDFTKAKMTYENVSEGFDAKTEDLVSQTEEAKQRGDTCEIKNA